MLDHIKYLFPCTAGFKQACRDFKNLTPQGKAGTVVTSIFLGVFTLPFAGCGAFISFRLMVERLTKRESNDSPILEKTHSQFLFSMTLIPVVRDDQPEELPAVSTSNINEQTLSPEDQKILIEAAFETIKTKDIASLKTSLNLYPTLKNGLIIEICKKYIESQNSTISLHALLNLNALAKELPAEMNTIRTKLFNDITVRDDYINPL